MINPVLKVTSTYEPETETREQLNHRLAEANKLILLLMEKIEILQDINKSEKKIFELTRNRK